MKNGYSEPWLVHHINKMMSYGFSRAECNRITGMNTDWISQPLAQKRVSNEVAHKVLKALFEAEHYSNHEVTEIANSFQHIDFHKAFLMNSPTIEAMLEKIILIISHDLPAHNYRFEKRNGMLYVYHTCHDEKKEYLTPQGHFCFLFKAIETAFVVNGGDITPEVSIIQHSLPGAEDFSRFVSPNIYTKKDVAYIAFPIRGMRLHNAAYNPAVDSYMKDEFNKKYNHYISKDNQLIELINQQLSIKLMRGDSNICIEAIAENLNMSRSTLYRHLAECNITFTQLLEDERKAKAVSYLRETSLSLGEISDRLGYANLSAFNRAFKRWFDTNPSTLRA